MIGGWVLVAGATLLAGAGGGLLWTVPAVLAAFIAGVGSAWVRLIEIQRWSSAPAPPFPAISAFLSG